MPEGFFINLKDYCSYCGNFEPDIETLDCSSLSEPNKYITNIRCENAEHCEKLYAHLKRSRD
jgi:hypothetical protein